MSLAGATQAMPAPGRYSAGEITLMLRERLEALVRLILPDGRVEGGEWRGHGPDGGTWSVVLRGAKRGVWASWSDPRHRGDPLELVSWGLHGGDRRAAYRWALGWLGLEGGADRSRPTPQIPPSQIPPSRDRERERRDAERRRHCARVRWHGAKPDIVDGPVDAYLLGRSIDLRCLDEPLPALRFARAVWHRVLCREVPAMVAAVVDPATGRHLATHTTYLCQVGGGWFKLDIKPAKTTLAPFGGGVIALTRGPSRRPLREVPEGDRALVAEGIEDALTMALTHPEYRTLAAVSVGNLPMVALPPGIREVMLVEQRDGENDGVARARRSAVERWREEGRRVSVWNPPEGFKDANDYWRALQRRDGRGDEL
jgi:hypothetical protein